MSVIDNLIYDRTAADVQRVHDFRNRILAGGITALTASERAEYLAGMKGAYNASDLNRVGEAVQYLADRMVSCADGAKWAREGGNLLHFDEISTQKCEITDGDADDYTVRVTGSSTALVSYPLPNSVAGTTLYVSGYMSRTGSHATNVAVQKQYLASGASTPSYVAVTNADYVDNVTSFSDVAVSIPAGATNIFLRFVFAVYSDSSAGETAHVVGVRLRPVSGWSDIAASSLTDMPYDASKISVTPKQDWTMSDVPTQAQAATYIADLNMIRKQLPLPSNTPAVPASLDHLDYLVANNIERMLYVIDNTLTTTYNTVISNINSVPLSAAYTGEAICGTN